MWLTLMKAGKCTQWFCFQSVLLHKGKADRAFLVWKRNRILKDRAVGVFSAFNFLNFAQI